MMKWALNKKLALILSLTSIYLLFGLKVKVLELTDYESGQSVSYFRLKDNEFKILFTHSVMLSDVVEEYLVEGKDIILKKTKYKDYGAGLPTDLDYDFYIDPEGSFLVIDNIDKKIQELVYRLGSKRSNHRLLIGGKEYELLDYADEKRGILFTVEKINILNLFMKEVYK